MKIMLLILITSSIAINISPELNIFTDEVGVGIKDTKLSQAENKKLIETEKINLKTY
ncbi:MULTISPECIES: hypothetical protein [unclassified Romboutsia]|uniref:hypothetical protein n=1 Tax=unclassified Romboutsia TaxID=2626894 RepID=UPI0013DDCA4B|nr:MULTISPECIES: hypothetical protein [unclassified Romboutsia]